MADELETQVEDEPLTTDSEPAVDEPVFSADPSEITETTEPESQETAAAPEAQQTQQSLRDQLLARGIPVQGDNDQAVLDSLTAYNRQMQAFANLGRQFLPKRDQFAQWEASQAQQPAPAQQAAEAKALRKKWEKLEYDPQWQSLVTQDEQGNLVPKSQYVDPSVPQKIMAYNNALRERLSELANDPISVIQDSVEDLIESRLEQRLNSERQRQQEQTFAAQAISQNQHLFFAADAQGNPLVDQAGQRVLSAEGQVYANAVAQAHAAGIHDTYYQNELGMGAVRKAREQAGYQAAPANGTPTAQPDKRKQFIDRINPATRTPNRNGTVRTADRTDFSQNPSKSLFQQMIEDYREKVGSLETV